MSAKQFTIIGSFFANGRFLDNNYLYFDLPDSELEIIEKLILDEFNTLKFKKVKSKKKTTSLYYSSKEFKAFLINAMSDVFNLFNSIPQEEFYSLVIGFGKGITINSVEKLNILCEILDKKNISYKRNQMEINFS